MGAVVNSWTLSAPDGARSRCVVQAAGRGYDVIVWSGDSIVLWERLRTKDAALARSDEYWTLLVAHGRLPAEPAEVSPAAVFARTCPECRVTASTLRYVRNQFGVLACANCGFRWNDRIRAANHDRRARSRPAVDRRRAA